MRLISSEVYNLREFRSSCERPSFPPPLPSFPQSLSPRKRGAGIHRGGCLAPPGAIYPIAYETPLPRGSPSAIPNEWPVSLAERGQHLDPDSTTRVPAPAVPQGGLDEPERRVGLRLRRFGRRTRRWLAEYHPGGVAYGRFALRPPNSRPVLLPIEALRNRGDCLPRRRLVRTHLRLPVSG